MFNEAEKWELVLMWKWKTKKKKILHLWGCLEKKLFGLATNSSVWHQTVWHQTVWRLVPDQPPEVFSAPAGQCAVSPQRHRTWTVDSLNPRARWQHWNTARRQKTYRTRRDCTSRIYLGILYILKAKSQKQIHILDLPLMWIVLINRKSQTQAIWILVDLSPQRTELLTRAWQYWVEGGPVGGRSCEHICPYSPGCGAQSLRRAQPGESWRCRSWCCGKQTSLRHLLCSPARK